MKNIIRIITALIISLVALVINAKQMLVHPSDNLQQLINNAKNNDTFILKKGIYNTKLTINNSIHLQGESGAKIIADNKGNAITVNASGVIIENLFITGSGLDLSTQDSGIFVNKTANNTIIRNNFIENNLIGVYLWGAQNSLIINNKIIGRKDMHENDRGNGIQLWNSSGSKVINNDISYGRDGIFVTTSKQNEFSDNVFKNLRYSIHYMYTNNSIVKNNISIGNDIGYALMSSSHLGVYNNLSINDKDHGIFLNFLNNSKITANVVINNRGKCVFIYNSNQNKIANNYFNHCNIGVHFTAGSANNEFYNNAFINNQKQVKYVGTKYLEWSHNNKGNYWSDHSFYDLNNDSIADVVYRPNSIVDQILWRYPNAKILLSSPVILVLKWSQQHFPSLLPGGVIDSYPLMSAKNIASKTLATLKRL